MLYVCCICEITLYEPLQGYTSTRSCHKQEVCTAFQFLVLFVFCEHAMALKNPF